MFSSAQHRLPGKAWKIWSGDSQTTDCRKPKKSSKSWPLFRLINYTQPDNIYSISDKELASIPVITTRIDANLL
jgi:hypothetical protein